LHVQLLNKLQIPNDEQTSGFDEFFPLQLVNSQLLPEYPTLQEHLSNFSQFPFPEQTFDSLELTP
jgi:hypothetical protein